MSLRLVPSPDAAEAPAGVLLDDVIAEAAALRAPEWRKQIDADPKARMEAGTGRTLALRMLEDDLRCFELEHVKAYGVAPGFLHVLAFHWVLHRVLETEQQEAG